MAHYYSIMYIMCGDFSGVMIVYEVNWTFKGSQYLNNSVLEITVYSMSRNDQQEFNWLLVIKMG